MRNFLGECYVFKRIRVFVMVAAVSAVQTGLLSLVPGWAEAQIEEIVVTARKKEESLQEVPLLSLIHI